MFSPPPHICQVLQEVGTSGRILKWVLNIFCIGPSGGGTGGGGLGGSAPLIKSDWAKGMFSPQYLPSTPRSRDLGKNFEVGAEHILYRFNTHSA